MLFTSNEVEYMVFANDFIKEVCTDCPHSYIDEATGKFKCDASDDDVYLQDFETTKEIDCEIVTAIEKESLNH